MANKKIVYVPDLMRVGDEEGGVFEVQKIRWWQLRRWLRWWCTPLADRREYVIQQMVPRVETVRAVRLLPAISRGGEG